MSSAQSMPSPAELKPAHFRPVRMPLDRLTLPQRGEIHVWFLDLPVLAQSLRVALDGHVGPGDPYRFTAGQLKFARRFFLRLLVGAYLGLPGKSVSIRREPRGKPALDASVHAEPLQFSTAKSGSCLLAGFSTCSPVGVDLEPADRVAKRPLALARRYFSAAERAGLEAVGDLQRDAAFLRTWACKEAVVKASGQGIANQLCRFTVETDPARPVALLAGDGLQPKEWSLVLLRPVSGFLGAVASPAPRLAVRARRLLPVGPEKS